MVPLVNVRRVSVEPVILYIPLLLPEYIGVRPLALKHGPTMLVSIMKKKENYFNIIFIIIIYIHPNLSTDTCIIYRITLYNRQIICEKCAIFTLPFLCCLSVLESSFVFVEQTVHILSFFFSLTMMGLESFSVCET